MKMMKTLATVITLLVLPFSLQAAGVGDNEIGLSKTSVFDTPTPNAVNYSGGMPGKNKRLDKSYHTAPPMIPHDVKSFLPITRYSNNCILCHNRPDGIGKPTANGVAPAMSIHHYTDPQSSNVDKSKVDGSRHFCTQCHRPQADAPNLVENTFKPDH